LYTQYFVIHYNNSCYHFNVLHCYILSYKLKSCIYFLVLKFLRTK
jgi:hypothetical protein